MNILHLDLARFALPALLVAGLAACGNDGGGGSGGGDTPDAFTLTDIDNAVADFVIHSEHIRIQGLGEGVEVDATVTGGYMSVNAAAADNKPVKVANGDHIQVVVIASSTPGETVTATLDIGGVSDEFTVTTAEPGLAIANAGSRLRLTWNAMSGAAYFTIYEDRTGADGFTRIGTAASDATSFEASISAGQYAWGEARFALGACNHADGCWFIAEITPAPSDSAVRSRAANSGESARFNAFGARIALDAAGLTAAVGEPFRAVEKADDGMVHVFTREPGPSGKGPWTKQATVQLPADRLGDFAQFGYSIALSNDGNTLVAGAPFSSNGTATGNGVGSVCIFTRTNAAWDTGTCIDNPSTDADHFGEAVAINETGDRIVVGAPREDSDDPLDSSANGRAGEDSGAAYVFDEIDGAWTRVAYLKQDTISSFSEFGTSVAVAGKGVGSGVLLIGASGEHGRAGAAYYFTDSPGGGISLDRKFVSDNPDEFDRFDQGCHGILARDELSQAKNAGAACVSRASR